ncbi:leucine--tRNA ligase [Thermoplasma sp.]|uniref:leucine--tRNA ligase n=1 Tax=Thermoplasma sp. TaxID=1973142 RepID=UPI002639E40E|nr:leucine--tRNA ligase [Thermoplasma sp.]
MDIETKWQNAWERDGIFVPKIDERKKFMITVPWPYTNGSLHVGHGRTYTLGDIIARYKRSRNYNVLFPMGFHQSGTPILAFSERIRAGDRATIDLYRSYLQEYGEKDVDSIIESFKDPKNIADYFSNAIINDFKRLGYSIDWTRRFTSADEFYQKFVQWQFRRLNDKGLVKQGKYPILYSLDDDNAVGEDDIKDGDTDKVTIEEYTAIFFHGRSFDLIAASLRPETIYGITNLWINPNARYVKIRIAGREAVVSENCFTKLKFQRDDVVLLGEISTATIQKYTYETPTKKQVKVYQADFVDPDDGTGIVYSVPSHSVYDYVYYKKKRGHEFPVIIEAPIKMADIEAKYDLNSDEGREEATRDLYRNEFYYGKLIDSGKYTGMPVREAREAVKKDLIDDGNAFIFYETSRHAVTRSGSKVIVAVLPDQWFLDYSQTWLKDLGHSMINSMVMHPEVYRSVMNDAIDWLRERPCARRRGLGTKLPFDDRWVIESLSDSTIYPAVYTNSLQLRDLYIKGDLNDEVMTRIFLEGSPLNDKEEEAKKQFNYWYPVDIRLTAIPHISNHLSFYVLNHAAIFPKERWPAGLIISGLVVSNGAKISKSKGNVISLLEITKKYSADIYRLYVAVQADISSTMDWNETDLAGITRRFNEFKDLLSKFKADESDLNFYEAWFVARFAVRLKQFFESMDKYQIRDAYINIFYGVLNDLKYLASRGGDVNRAITPVLADWIRSLMPVIPHHAEEYWHMYVSDTYVSVDPFQENFMDRYERMVRKFAMTCDQMYNAMDYVERVLQDIKNIVQVTGMEPRSVEITVANDDVMRAAQEFLNNSVSGQSKKYMQYLVKRRKDIMIYGFDEYDVLQRNQVYISKEIGCPIRIQRGDVINGKIALPGKPVIYIS